MSERMLFGLCASAGLALGIALAAGYRALPDAPPPPPVVTPDWQADLPGWESQSVKRVQTPDGTLYLVTWNGQVRGCAFAPPKAVAE